MTVVTQPPSGVLPQTKAFVGREWVDGESRRPVFDPASGEVIAEVEVAGAELCRRAVDAASAAFGPWLATPPRERAEILRRAFERMTAESENIARLITRENGVPAGVVNVVVAAPTALRVREMLHDPRVTNLSFTGSTEVGVILLHEAAHQVVPTSMELGGNAPFLVLAGADVDDAVAGAMVAKLRNGGAACTAANRFYVHRSVADAFTTRLADAMRSLMIGPGLDPDSQIASLVSVEERDKVAALVDAAVRGGATVVTGAGSPDRAGAFYFPTVLADVDPGADGLTHEIFGPVAPIVVVDSDEEAIRLADASPFGLISYVYAGDLRRGMRVADALESGMVAVNRGVVSDPAAPFGGYKQSGLGRERRIRRYP
jgi:succinate-semialdehyde dehydrogenase/glutarate-semialdehyde dehydrogenase